MFRISAHRVQASLMGLRPRDRGMLYPLSGIPKKSPLVMFAETPNSPLTCVVKTRSFVAPRFCEKAWYTAFFRVALSVLVFEGRGRVVGEFGRVLFPAFEFYRTQEAGASDVHFCARGFVGEGEQGGQDEYDQHRADERASRDEEGHLLYDEVGGHRKDAETRSRHDEGGSEHGHHRSRGGEICRLSGLEALAQGAELCGDEYRVVHRSPELHRRDDEIGHEVYRASREYVLHDEVDPDAELDEGDEQDGEFYPSQREYQDDEYRDDGDGCHHIVVAGGDSGEVMRALGVTREIAGHPGGAEYLFRLLFHLVEDVEAGLALEVDRRVYPYGIHSITPVYVT